MKNENEKLINKILVDQYDELILNKISTCDVLHKCICDCTSCKLCK